MPTVTVAVFTRDRVDELLRCLESLRAQDAPPPNEILIVDNAPPDDRTREVVQRLGGIPYVEEISSGLSFARNRALDEARGDVVAFLDDDAVATPGWLRAVGRLFAWEPGVGVSSGPVVPAELETRAQELFERRGGFAQTFQRRTYARSPPADSAALHRPLLVGVFGTGCNLAIRRDVRAPWVASTSRSVPELPPPVGRTTTSSSASSKPVISLPTTLKYSSSTVIAPTCLLWRGSSKAGAGERPRFSSSLVGRTRSSGERQRASSSGYSGTLPAVWHPHYAEARLRASRRPSSSPNSPVVFEGRLRTPHRSASCNVAGTQDAVEIRLLRE